MSSMETTNLSIETLKGMLESGLRFDGRKLLEHRDISVELGISNKAEGSARVRVGKTEVLAGVKLQVGAPYPDSKDKGNLMVSGDMLPLASPRFESGPPDFTAIELPRLVDRAIRESHMIDLHKLVINEEKVWTVIVDVYPINDDGNLIDVATLAAVIALKNTHLPGLTKELTVDYDEKTDKKLPVSKETNPISFTFFKIGNAVLLDPTREEEEACDVRVSIGISKWNGHYMINSCQKTGVTPFTQAEIASIMDIVEKKYDELSETLKKFL